MYLQAFDCARSVPCYVFKVRFRVNLTTLGCPSNDGKLRYGFLLQIHTVLVQALHTWTTSEGLGICNHSLSHSTAPACSANDRAALVPGLPTLSSSTLDRTPMKHRMRLEAFLTKYEAALAANMVGKLISKGCRLWVIMPYKAQVQTSCSPLLLWDSRNWKI